MLINELSKKYPSLKVIKAYPESGQKQVYQVSLDAYSVVMLKIIKKMDDRIRREIDIVNQNNIPGVPKIKEISSFQYNGEEHYYLFEEYIDGETLTDVLKRGPLALPQSLKLFESLLIVVAKLESLGIVHRDIKPDNIICAKDGNYHLIDFQCASHMCNTKNRRQKSYFWIRQSSAIAPCFIKSRCNGLGNMAEC